MGAWADTGWPLRCGWVGTCDCYCCGALCGGGGAAAQGVPSTVGGKAKSVGTMRAHTHTNTYIAFQRIPVLPLGPSETSQRNKSQLPQTQR